MDLIPTAAAPYSGGWIKAYTVSGLYFVLIAMLAGLCLLKPTYNWDLLGYMGSALSWSESNPERLHSEVYEEAASEIPSAQFLALTQGSYRADMAHSPTDYDQQLPFYAVRPIYTGLMAFLHRLGLSLVHSAYTISALSYLATALLLYVWLARYFPLPVAALYAGLISISPPLFGIARLATADSLSAALLLGALFSLLELDHKRWFFALMLLSVYARSDNVVFSAAAGGFLLYDRDRLGFTASELLLFLSLCIASYLGISYYSGNYGWSTVFYHTFVHLLTAPARTPVHISPRNYFAALKTGTETVGDSGLALWAVLGLLAFRLWRQQLAQARRIRVFLLATLATIGMRYILFPLLINRFLAAFDVFTLVMVLIGASLCLRPSSTFHGPITQRETSLD